MKYLVIVISVCIFVIGYVWQNIEVMRVKMNFRRLQIEEKSLVNKNGRLVYEIERMRSYQSVSKLAQAKGYKKISSADIDVILMQDVNEKKTAK